MFPGLLEENCKPWNSFCLSQVLQSQPKSRPSSRRRYTPSFSFIWFCELLFNEPKNLRRGSAGSTTAIFHFFNQLCAHEFAVRMFAQSRRPCPVLLLHGLQDLGSRASPELSGINRGEHPQWVSTGRKTAASQDAEIKLVRQMEASDWKAARPTSSGAAKPKVTRVWCDLLRSNDQEVVWGQIPSSENQRRRSVRQTDRQTLCR